MRKTRIKRWGVSACSVGVKLLHNVHADLCCSEGSLRWGHVSSGPLEEDGWDDGRKEPANTWTHCGSDWPLRILAVTGR